jgi:hypothetical protein
MFAVHRVFVEAQIGCATIGANRDGVCVEGLKGLDAINLWEAGESVEGSACCAIVACGPRSHAEVVGSTCKCASPFMVYVHSDLHGVVHFFVEKLWVGSWACRQPQVEDQGASFIVVGRGGREVRQNVLDLSNLNVQVGTVFGIIFQGYYKRG